MVGRIFLGRYEAVRVLGEGGMGRVYLARQLDLGRQVVVKVMHDHLIHDPQFNERFQGETLLMARFQHPYAVTLYDASLNDPEGPCIVMEYLHGVTVDTLLKNNGRLSPARVGRLLGQLCEVLQAAHSQGIIHRDLKPPNLMVIDPDTPYEKIKVMDFGLAKLLGDNPRKLTDADFTVGTPGYICPEQVRGEKVDHRGDLYSVGVILFELLTGRLPFADRSTMDVLLAHATEEPPSFRALGADDLVPPAIEAVVQSCLAKDPSQRPADARELAERFETALAHEEVVVERAAAEAPPPVARPAVVTAARPLDPYTMAYQLEAWMPEKIAAYKLRGFVQDVGGEVLESVPGLIRVRLGGTGSAYAASPPLALALLGLGRRYSLIEMELRLQRAEAASQGQLQIDVLMRSLSRNADDLEWRARCDQIYCDLRGYLMGSNSHHGRESVGV
jgi:serine/threonine-protein kinase